MNYSEQYINVRGRNVEISKNLRECVQEKDNNSEKVLITMDRFYDEIDFDTKQVNLVIRNPMYEEIIVNLNTVKTVKDNELEFNFVFTEEITKYRGWLDIVFVVTEADYKWQSKQINKAIFIASNFTYNEQPVPPQYFVDLEEYRQEILGYMQDTKDQVLLAQNEVNNAKLEVGKAKEEVTKATISADRANAEANRAEIAASEAAADVEALLDSKVQMATTEANRAKTEADRSRDEAEAVVAEINEKIDKKILYNGDESNFDFIGNEVVKDGLVDFPSFIPSNSNFTLMFGLYETQIASNTSLVRCGEATNFSLYRYNKSLFMYQDNKQYAFTTDLKLEPFNEFCLIRNENKFILLLNGVSYQTITPDIKDLNQPFIGLSVSYNRLLFDRILSTKEIYKNLSVTNNSPSLKSTEITDAEGRKTTHLFGSDEDHVEMATGRTLRDEYMGVLATMGKEFVADATGKISVDNGVKNSRLISGEIQGQTVKNEFYNRINNTRDVNGVFSITGTDIGLGAKLSSSPYYDSIKLQSSKTYTVILEILTTNYVGNIEFGLNLGGTKARILANEVGVKYATFNTDQNFSDDQYFVIQNTTTDRVEGKYVTFRYGVYEGDLTISKPIKSLQFGLSSTQAIINNNGQSYPIYEPTIVGKTRTLKALKGTQNWVEISPDEARDTVAYDYKLDSINGDLGSAHNVSDYVDRARKVKVVNTFEEVLRNDIVATTSGSQPSDTSYMRFAITLNTYKSNTPFITDKFKVVSGNPSSATEEFEYSGNYIYAVISKSKLTTQDVNGFKQWLQANPVTVRYQLVTPQEVQLTDEEFKAYDKHKKLILLGGVESYTNKLILLDNGDSIFESNTRTIKVDGSNVTQVKDTGTLLIGNINLTNFASPYGKCYAICDKFPNNGGAEGVGNVVNKGIYKYNYGATMYLAIEKGGYSTISEALNDNPIIIEYAISSPTIVHIDKTLTPTILTDKINILEVESPVAPSSFKVVTPVDKFSALEAEVSRLTNIIESISNNAILSNYALDKYNELKERV